MFKSFFLVTSLLLSTLIFAQDTIETAKALYSERGLNFKKALEAANIYENLAAAESDSLKKANLFTKQSQAIFFYGDQNTEAKKKELLSIYKKGMTAAKNASNLLSDDNGLTTNEVFKTQLATAYYFYSAHLGKWGETKGVLASLGKWKSKLKPTLKKILALDPSVEGWGANRILARAYQKVPYESTSKGLEYILEAYENTLNEDYSLATNMTTNEYVLYLTKDEKEWDIFCEVYSAVEEISEDEDAQLELNPNMLPEIQNTIKEILENKSFKKSFRKKCE